MDLLYIVILSTVSFIELFLLTKIMGNRQMSQLSMFDYIIGITIGSIAAEMSTSLEDNFLEPLVAMLLYALFSLLIAVITKKSMKSRKWLEGTPVILMNNGKIFRNSFKKSKLDLNEFLMECRVQGYFNVADIQVAILEPNGKISIVPKARLRPATPEDLGIDPKQEKLVTNVIVDGQVITQNLQLLGKDMDWLKKQIKQQHSESIQSIFLATCDSNDNLSIYPKYNTDKKHNLLEE